MRVTLLSVMACISTLSHVFGFSALKVCKSSRSSFRIYASKHIQLKTHSELARGGEITKETIILDPKKLALLSLRDMYEVGESRTSLGTPFLRNLPDLFLDRQLLSRNPSIMITSPYQHNDCFSNCIRVVFSGLKQ